VDMIRRKYLSSDGGPGQGPAAFRPLDFARAAQFFTLDAVTKIAYGEEFGYLATDSDVHGYMEATEEQMSTVVLLAEIPYLGRILEMPWVMRMIGPKKTDHRGMGKMLAQVTPQPSIGSSGRS